MCFSQRIERVEELFLSTIFSANELNVVDQEQIKRVIIFLESVERFMLVSTYYI